MEMTESDELKMIKPGLKKCPNCIYGYLRETKSEDDVTQPYYKCNVCRAEYAANY